LNNIVLQQQIALTFLNGTGRRKMRTILSHIPDVDTFFHEKKKNLLKIPGVGEASLIQMNRDEALKKAAPFVDYYEKNNFKTHFFQDADFPLRLNQCDDAPILLFSHGEMDLNPPKIISIVGTRNATEYGKVICDELLHALVDKNVVIVSGLAYGIDIYVHQLCVQLGIQTIGVLGHGLDRIYPSSHKQTAKQMTQNGGLLTEFLPGTMPDRMNFPMRNRIVAGMCDATIVIESGAKGGSLITAELANDYSRDVFAYPGDINKEYSKGCNYLIQQNRAHLITGSKDFFRIMGWDTNPVKAPKQQNLFQANLSDLETKLVDILKEKESASLDFISLKSGESVSEVSVNLLNLEFLGVVKTMPGNRFKLLS
jgi:DNA processing protein